MPIIESFLAFSDNALLYYPNLFFVIVPLILLGCLYSLIKTILIFSHVLHGAIKAEFRKPRAQGFMAGVFDASHRGTILNPGTYDRGIAGRAKIIVKKKAFVKKYHKFYLFISFLLKTIRVRTEEITYRFKKEVFIDE